MNHFEFAMHESAMLTPTPWDRWYKTACDLAGHDLDGDGDMDGYSLDGASDAFDAGEEPHEYVNRTNAANRPPKD